MNWVLTFDLKVSDFGREEIRGEGSVIKREGDEFVVLFGDMNSMIKISFKSTSIIKMKNPSK